MTKKEITQRIIELKLGPQTVESKKEIQILQQELTSPDIDVVTRD